jgi:hypothetical protein
MQIHANVIFVYFVCRHSWAYRYFGFTSSALGAQLRLFLKQTPKIQIIQWNLGLVEILILWHEEDEGKGIGHILSSFSFSVSLSLNLIMVMYFLLFRLWTTRRENEQQRTWAMQ